MIHRGKLSSHMLNGSQAFQGKGVEEVTLLPDDLVSYEKSRHCGHSRDGEDRDSGNFQSPSGAFLHAPSSPKTVNRLP
jgi:hypothetical protein